jgi:hypothetical protein
MRGVNPGLNPGVWRPEMWTSGPEKDFTRGAVVAAATPKQAAATPKQAAALSAECHCLGEGVAHRYIYTGRRTVYIS